MKHTFVILLLLIGLQACAIKQWQPAQYVVAKGDTLYAIAWRYRVDYKKLAKWNNIRSPYTIYAGQRLWVGSPPASSTQNKPVVARTAKPANKPSTKKTPRVISKPDKPAQKTNWRWPLRKPYTLIKKFKGPSSVSQGIDIAGELGKSVYAAADGNVVYSGNGLIGYGNLVIVKHNDTYLSAYALNHKLYVKEGQQVKAGQKIASMGVNADKKPTLHFEIRRYGKPVNPIKYLP